MTQDNLNAQTKKGLIWSAIDRFATQGVSFVVTLVMARLLSPSDYGLIAMLTIFVVLAQSIVDSGFTNALIRKQDRTDVDNSTVFYSNIAIGSLIYLLLFSIAPQVAQFYQTDELSLLMRILCLIVVINSFGVVQRALLTVAIDFKTQAKISATAAITSGVVGIAMAYLDFGVWALVAQQLTSASISNGLLWVLTRWRPILAYSWTSIRELFSFGSKLMISGVIDTVYNNIYPIVIGRIYSSDQLGHYARAQHFSQFPSSNITGIIQRVTFPILCKFQDDDEKLSRVYRKFLRLSAFVEFPLMMGLAAISTPLVEITIGEKWAYCASLLQIICFNMMWHPIHSINLNLLQVKGKSNLFLRLEIIKKILGTATICITAPIGVKAMCYGGVVNSVIALVINTFYTGRLINVGFLRQMRDVLHILLLSLFMFCSTSCIVHLLSSSNWLSLAGGLTLGGTIFLVGAYVLKFTELTELWQFVGLRKTQQ